MSNDEESNYADKEDVLLCTNSCLPSAKSCDDESMNGTKSTRRDQIQYKHECTNILDQQGCCKTLTIYLSLPTVNKLRGALAPMAPLFLHPCLVYTKSLNPRQLPWLTTGLVQWIDVW